LEISVFLIILNCGGQRLTLIFEIKFDPDLCVLQIQ